MDLPPRVRILVHGREGTNQQTFVDFSENREVPPLPPSYDELNSQNKLPSFEEAIQMENAQPKQNVRTSK